MVKWVSANGILTVLLAAFFVEPPIYSQSAVLSGFQNNQIGIDTFVSGPQGQILLQLNNDLFRNASPSGDEWSRIGSNVKAVSLDPSNEKVIYAISTQNSVTKTMDQGEHWLTLDTGTPNQNLAIIFVNPVNSQQVYVGGPSGLLRTEDAGFSWQHTGWVGPVSQFVIDPQAPNTIFVLSVGGIYASTDQGVTWKRSATGLPTELVKGAGRTATKTVAPVSLLFAVGRQKPLLLAAVIGRGVFRSEDNGATWVASGSGLDSVQPFVAASLGKDQITLESGSSLFRSSDGSNWSRVSIESGKNSPVTLNGVIECSFKKGLLLNFRFPNDGDIENVGPQRRVGFLDTGGMLIGLNYGVLHHSEVDGVWTAQQNGKTILFAVTFNGEDLDQVERSHRPTFLYTSKDDGYSWQLIGNSPCGDTAARPSRSTSEEWIYGAGSCVMRTADGGLTWEQMPGFNFIYSNASVTDMKFDPARHNILFYSTGVNERHLMRYQYNQDSRQGQAVDLKTQAASFVVDQNNPSAIFTDKAQLTTDGGWTWTDKSRFLNTACKCDVTTYYIGSAKPLSFQNGDIRMLIANGANAFNGHPGDIAVMRSQDSGESWQRISQLSIAGLRAGPFVNPDDSQDAFIVVLTAPQGTSGAFGSSYRPDTLKVLETKDGGMNWKEIARHGASNGNNSDAIFRGITQFSSNGSRSLLLATSVGLLRSEDEGHTWSTLGGIR